MTIYISDQAEEFRIEISGWFAGSSVSDAAAAWQAALSVNIPRRISVDITRMTGYDRVGYMLLRDIYSHGTHMAAGTPRALLFLTQISAYKPTPASAEDAPRQRRQASKQEMTRPVAVASGE